MIHIIRVYLKMAYFIIFRKKIISTRCACFGQDALIGYNLVNRQKFRVDLPWSRAQNQVIHVAWMINFNIKFEIRDLIYQQAFNFWKISIKYSDFFIMDTYSELTDRLYQFNQFDFTCHRGDFLQLDNDFGSGSLIESDSLTEHYQKFFKKIREVNNDIKIIVILFPIKFESRPKYIEQYNCIKNSLSLCATEDLLIIELDESIICKDPSDNYPYHIGQVTHQHLRSLIDSVINKI